MEIERLLLIMSFSIAVFSALFCSILLLIRLFWNKDEFIKRVIILLISGYIVEIIYVITIFFYNFDKDTFIQTKPVNFLTMLLLPVMFYHLIFKITRLRTAEQFSFWHYVLPLSLAAGYGLWFALTPWSILLLMDAKDIQWIAGYKGFIFFDYSRFYIRLILSLIYLGLAANRVIRYRKEIVQYSSNMEETSLAWLYQIFGVLFLVIPFPVLYYFIGSEIYTKFVGLVVPLLFILLLNVTTCYHIFRQNFILLTEDIIADRLSEQEKESREPLSHEVVSKYMDVKKPYLDPNLKITDLITAFGTNRTYLSSFINTTYGLNFSMYINRYRLEEFQRLKELPENKMADEEELVYLAGFRSHQSFKRSEKILKSAVNTEPNE
ncbi:helix-turn-helix transcriptional regulator [Chryseobacterium sp. KMC2]|uniref:helix-turn-helix transcriptional regulator n=1 Tax=Chryseobacterium sp. KMC2 TaxID=2800705 RepID=UPI001924FE8F|nr:helix-turn-helix transcriptional regulator [Chryseobacterium sp. KMC2]MBL3548855.1 helix-turn-helix transcriptional regulator [Chryseobacterium sp. KMC2]